MLTLSQDLGLIVFCIWAALVLVAVIGFGVVPDSDAEVQS